MRRERRGHYSRRPLDQAVIALAAGLADPQINDNAPAVAILALAALTMAPAAMNGRDELLQLDLCAWCGTLAWRGRLACWRDLVGHSNRRRLLAVVEGPGLVGQERTQQRHDVHDRAARAGAA